MRAAGTYFEQVPKAVVEKIIAREALPADNEIGSDAAAEKPAAINSSNRTKSRNPKT